MTKPPVPKQVSNTALSSPKLGRPALYNEATFSEIMERVTDGQSLTRVLRRPGMPSFSTFFKWIADSERARERWHIARELFAHNLALSTRDIIDDVARKRLEPDRARVMLGGLQWLAGKFAPRHYSDKFGQVDTLNLVIQTNLDLTTPQQGQDLSQPGTYTLVAHAPSRGEGEPPEGSHRPPAKIRGGRRPAGGPKNGRRGTRRKNETADVVDTDFEEVGGGG